jgi:hypothetical protein
MRVDVADGMDDVALAFAADAWSRTGHVTVQAAAPAPVQLRSGITLLPDATTDSDALPLPLTPGLKPMEQLDRTLCEIGSRFGVSRREWVMIELE